MRVCVCACACVYAYVYACVYACACVAPAGAGGRVRGEADAAEEREGEGGGPAQGSAGEGQRPQGRPGLLQPPRASLHSTEKERTDDVFQNDENVLKPTHKLKLAFFIKRLPDCVFHVVEVT